jgi:lipopolysaccharide biosynthesis regulator YciM
MVFSFQVVATALGLSPLLKKQTMDKKIMAALVILICLGTLGCKTDKRVTHAKDYAVYLQGGQSQKLQYLDGEIRFWANRLQKTPGDMTSEIKLAGLYSQRYAYSGNIGDVKTSDSLYLKANQLQGKFGSGLYRSLATNCITQHRFRQAQSYLDTALAMGDDKKLSLQQQFDVALELGDRAFAKTLLEQLGSKTEPAYLLRSAKYKDHILGDLDGAIADMEKALAKIEASENEQWTCWAKTNLGDMYNHANRFAKAYQCYTEVLQKDKQYYHALKGIAWLAYSHDKDTTAAIGILKYLQQQHPVPDYDLMLAEIAAYGNDKQAAQQYAQTFLAEVQQPQYGGMYNKYIFNLLYDEPNAGQQALQLAQTEVQNRPTAESYYLLSKAYYKNGQTDLAMQTAKRYVENKCFEPEVLYHLGLLYQQVGNKTKAQSYLQEAAASSVELGPVRANQINALLN